jgi:glycosyltransferase involved in cell wall biosynthesis
MESSTLKSGNCIGMNNVTGRHGRTFTFPNRFPTIDDYLKAPAHHFRQAGGCRSAIKRQCSPEQPLVTINTIVRNQKDTLPQTIMSVLSQSYPNIEYIVVDGASNDGTLEVIKQFDDKIDLWISEPDRGTGHASNKAISLARGDMTFWLAGDDWIEPDFIELAVKAILSSGADFVFGNMVMYKDEKIFSVHKGEKDYAKSLMSGNPRFNFPSMVIKRACWQKLGLTEETFKLTADYEWTLRLHLAGGNGFYESRLIVHRRVGGVGDQHPFRGLLERLKILRLHGLPTTKAVVIYLSILVRRGVGYFVKLFLPNIIYKKLKRAVGKASSVPPK